MNDENFSFKFPEFDFDFKSLSNNDLAVENIEKINEYLNLDLEEQDILLNKLKEFEQKLDMLSKNLDLNYPK